jgi:hypothetical protein
MRIGRRHARWVNAAAVMGLAVPLFLAGAHPAGGAPEPAKPSSSQPTQVNITNDLAHRYGEAEIAVNPKNPKNLVYFVMQEHYTYACAKAAAPDCQLTFGAAPSGYLNVPGFIKNKVFVSFDAGRTWKSADFPGFPKGHSDLLSNSDPMVTATPDGTFYIAWNALHLSAKAVARLAVLDGGIAVSKSTDGGRTWSRPVFSGTPTDRPWLTSDASTGTIYVSSGTAKILGLESGRLGPTSTGDENAALGSINDRWIVASKDGVHWTKPHRLGGGGTPGFASGSLGLMSAAHGVVATAFGASDADECQFFVHTAAPCTVFQTTRDAGVTWVRHAVPLVTASGTSEEGGFILVAADPAHRGRYAVAALDATGAQFAVYRTVDSGKTWHGPTTLTDDSTTTKSKPWMAYSPRGVLGIMWLSNTAPGAPAADQALPVSVWAATSTNGGATFSKPLEISTGPSQPDPLQRVGTTDFDFITFDPQHAFVLWSDWRPGEASGYLSVVKLKAFKR